MYLSATLNKQYCEDNKSAKDAQDLAEFIAWAPVVFQCSFLMVKFGILELLDDSDDGLTLEEIRVRTGVSEYAVKCLMEGSLCIGLVIVNQETSKFTISKTGWFLLNDPATRINLDFNKTVLYRGMYRLEESLKEGKPEGLKSLGTWSTLYEGLSHFPDEAKRSWLNFDHYYSDSSFPEALKIVFDNHQVETLYDVGGNTGKWALQCVTYSKSVKVTILDLPQQLTMMKENVKDFTGSERIDGYAIDFLNSDAQFPGIDNPPDVIWMSQFLDCFSMEQIVNILLRAKKVMSENTRLYIMETLWDRQRFPQAAFCLTMTSLYFSNMANGNSKMYNTEDLTKCIMDAGLEIETIHDNLGLGHSILTCKKKKD